MAETATTTEPLDLSDLKFDKKLYVDNLRKIIGNVEKLQNSPPLHVPQESLSADIVVKYLEPVTQPKGPLIVKKLEYVEGRSNLFIELPAGIKTEKCVSFVGSHMDVVPANPEEWKVNPFELTIDKDNPDKVYGRGVTDCSGHVALLAQLMYCLAEKAKARPFDINVFVIMIANEENSSVTGVGIDEMERQGELNKLKDGPLYWVDSANFGPTLGTAGMCAWELKVTGKKFHSGLPHKGINAIEAGMQAVQYLQSTFYKAFPTHEREEEYKFITSSSMKPTQIEVPPGSINQIPGECTIKGDIRFLPFYKWPDIEKCLVDAMNNMSLDQLPTYGSSRYELPAENLKAKFELAFINEKFYGVACDMESVGCKALKEAIDKYHPAGSKPFSLTGSLPIIAGLRDNGFDTQCVGFGRMDAYHAVNEYAMVSEYEQGFHICCHVIQNINNGKAYEAGPKTS